MGSYTKKETDFWGNEKEVHYENGEKVGETRHATDFWGNNTQKHYDTDGKETGSTRKEHGWFSDHAAHYDSKGEKIGETHNGHSFWGNEEQKHYDQDHNPVGRSEYGTGFWGDSRKIHDGQYFKGGTSPDDGANQNANQSGNSGRANSGSQRESHGSPGGGGMGGGGGSGCFVPIVVLLCFIGVGNIIYQEVSDYFGERAGRVSISIGDRKEPEKQYLTVSASPGKENESTRFNIRSGPSSKHAVVLAPMIFEGLQVEYLGEKENGWCKISYSPDEKEDKTVVGWISSDLTAEYNNPCR